MPPAWMPFPPAWMVALAFGVAGLTVVLRWHAAAGLGGRLHIFLLPPFAWLTYVYILAQLHIDNFHDPAVLGLAVRFCLLVVAALFSTINAVEVRDVTHMRRRLRELKIAA